MARKNKKTETVNEFLFNSEGREIDGLVSFYSTDPISVENLKKEVPKVMKELEKIRGKKKLNYKKLERKILL